MGISSREPPATPEAPQAPSCLLYTSPLGVVQLEGGALGLQLDLVFQLLAGDALVHETVAALVDLQEGLSLIHI